jgi:curved DNA-binding protein CbpA
MKRINQYKKLFDVTGPIDLKEIKTTYRNLVKEWHPDKFQADNPLAAEAEIKSKEIIDGYHFLVSIAPETKIANEAAYEITINEAGIADYHHKGLVLEVTFQDGNVYEYFGVTKSLYIKMVNADKPLRFAKRNIFNTFLYRKSKKALETA